MKKGHRDIIKEIKSHGIEVVDMNRKGTHYVLTLRNERGVVMRYPVPTSPSDNRGALNRRADMRRFAQRRGH